MATRTRATRTVSYGETVNYTVTVVIPETVAEKDIKVVDTITNGLTLNTAITVAGDENPTVASRITSLTFVQTDTVAAQDAVAADPTADPPVEAQAAVKAATIYTATIPAATVKANAGKILTLTYSATVNASAIVNDPEHNKAHIEYDNYVSVDKDTEVVTHGFTVKKIDGAVVTANMTDEAKFALTALDGAEFSLWTASTDGSQIKIVAVDASGNVINATDTTTSVAKYRVAQNATEEAQAVPIKVGVATIDGLAAATYYLQEDKAPDGYNKLSGRQSIAVSATTSPVGVDIAVQNNSGTELPSTGGIGTTIFYAVGLVLVLGAAAILIARRKADAE